MASLESQVPESSERTQLISRTSDGIAATRKGEVWEMLWLAMPLIVYCSLRYWIMGITIISTGHLGVTELAAASLGLLHSNVVGFSIILGSNSALDTLANQAAGCASPALASLYTLRQLVIQISMMPVIFMLMWYGTSIIHMLSPNADQDVLALTQTYLRIMVWALPVYAGTDCLRRFCASIGNVKGPTIANAIGMPVSVGLNILLVHGPEGYRLGFIGAPIAVVIAYYCIFFIMLLYALRTTPRRAWCGISCAIVQDLGLNLRLGVTGVVALCSEWWAFELLGVGSTYLGPTAQATTAIYSGVLAMCYPVPYAISLAAAIRVGNSIGAGQASQAKQAAGAAQKIALLVVLSAAGCLGIFHRQVATFYTNDNHVAQMFTANLLILIITVLSDGLQSVNSGILRGAGLPNVTANINVTAYWGIGIWISLILLRSHWTFPSLWSGYVVAIACAQFAVRYRITGVDWQKQVELAESRLVQPSSQAGNSIFSSEDS